MQQSTMALALRHQPPAPPATYNLRAETVLAEPPRAYWETQEGLAVLSSLATYGAEKTAAPRARWRTGSSREGSTGRSQAGENTTAA